MYALFIIFRNAIIEIIKKGRLYMVFNKIKEFVAPVDEDEDEGEEITIHRKRGYNQ